MQYAPIIAQDIMSAVDERNDCMAALHKLAAKFAADQPRGSSYENTATGESRHDSFLVLDFGAKLMFAAGRCHP